MSMLNVPTQMEHVPVHASQDLVVMESFVMVCNVTFRINLINMVK